MKNPGILIIGNGGAAIHAVLAARASGYVGTISIISDVDEPAFNPMLSPYFLADKIDFDQCFPFGTEFYERYGVTCLFGSGVMELDQHNREVLTENGHRIQYEKCLIATGARPVLPPVQGLEESDRVLMLRTSKDTKRLHKAASSAKSAVILGASLVGAKLADILNLKGLNITLIDVADQILPLTAHTDCATIIHEHIKKSGIDLRLGWSLERAEERGDEMWLSFKDNDSIRTDLCIVCTGVRPNLGFIKNSTIEIDWGILIDEKMRTSAEHVYAAGDVSQGMNLISGKREPIGLWGNACYQGRTAGFHMAGKEVRYPGTIPDHVSAFFGMTFVHLGDVIREGPGIRILSNKGLSDNGSFCLLVFDQGALVGANMINGLQDAGRLKRAIIRELDWSNYFNWISDNPIDTEISQILSMMNA